MLSLIIPVWNDADALAEWFARLTGPSLAGAEVIVADASAEPQKELIARCCAAAGARVVQCPQPSRGAQLNAGAAAATGEILVFTHADTELLPVHLAAILSAMQDPRIVGGAFYKDLGAHYPALAWAGPLVRWWTRHLGLIYGDQSVFLRSSGFLALGGFAKLPIMEDVEFSQRLRRRFNRHQFVHLDPPLRTSMRRFRQRGTLRTRLENVGLVCLWRLRLLTPTQIHRWYYDAK